MCTIVILINNNNNNDNNAVDSMRIGDMWQIRLNDSARGLCGYTTRSGDAALSQITLCSLDPDQ